MVLRGSLELFLVILVSSVILYLVARTSLYVSTSMLVSTLCMAKKYLGILTICSRPSSKNLRLVSWASLDKMAAFCCSFSSLMTKL